MYKIIPAGKKHVICSESNAVIVKDGNGSTVLNGRGLVVVDGYVAVYKRPPVQVVHREFLKANRLRYWLGDNTPLDDDRIIDGLLEPLEVIQ